MSKRIRFILSSVGVCLVFMGGAFFLREFNVNIALPNKGKDVKPFELVTDNSDETVKPITRQVLLSSPLLIFDKGTATPFTPKAVIDETNRQRAMAGVLPLKENEILSAEAEKKVRDMFENQYFEHISPKGVGPDGLAREYGYEYVSVGENLALGNFGDEASLVDAWMNSEGHRENILRSQFQEIGIAVGRGNFDGQQVLIAVQEFGRPLVSCPAVEASLKREIDKLRVQINTMSRNLENERKSIQNMAINTNRDDGVYADAINTYNKQVTEYNIIVDITKNKTKTYNDEVKAFNTCLQKSI